MTRHVLTFLATFVVGALLALAARTATHTPSEISNLKSQISAPKSQIPDPNSQIPDPKSQISDLKSQISDPSPPSAAPVNTLCAICGMKVDPAMPTLEYQGKRIGFGCRMCPPKFKADPDKYGPYYLRNEVIKR